MAYQLRYFGSLPGHKGWVIAIATSSENPDMILTASRGMLLLVDPMQLSHSIIRARTCYAYAYRTTIVILMRPRRSILIPRHHSVH